MMVAALLQYRWINRASEADLQERRLSLNGEMAGVKGQFNAAVQELLPMFRPARARARRRHGVENVRTGDARCRE